MDVECQVGRGKWVAVKPLVLGETTLTVQAEFVPRNYDVFAGSMWTKEHGSDFYRSPE